MEKVFSSLPDYENPPVAEVALSVQFEPLRRFRTPYIGLLWEKYQKRELKFIEEQPSIPQVFELFGEEKLIPRRVEISSLPPVSRCLFLNENRTELVQVQNDHFVHNWRKGEKTDTEYPRYSYIRSAFLEDLGIFQEFLMDHKIGELHINQCEIVYVNPIPINKESIGFDELQNIITIFRADYSDSFLPEIEGINISLSYIIRYFNEKPLGRLHISAQSKTLNNEKFIMLNLIARGRPLDNSIDGVLRFLDLGREHIVRGFTSITTPNMHKTWGRKE